MAETKAAQAVDTGQKELESFGYKQELRRGMGLWDVVLYGVLFMVVIAPQSIFGGIQLNTERSQKQGIVQLHPGRMGAVHVHGGVQIHAGDGSGADALRISLQKPVLPVTDPYPVVRKGGMGIVYDLNEIHF